MTRKDWKFFTLDKLIISQPNSEQNADSICTLYFVYLVCRPTSPCITLMISLNSHTPLHNSHDKFETHILLYNSHDKSADSYYRIELSWSAKLLSHCMISLQTHISLQNSYDKFADFIFLKNSHDSCKTLSTTLIMIGASVTIRDNVKSHTSTNTSRQIFL